MKNEAHIQHGLMRGPGGHKESIMHEYGDCSFCGGEVKEEFVELDYRYKQQLYIFRDVPTGVCQQCGEKYLVASTAKAIEHAIRTKKDWLETVAVPVTTFCNVAVV
jgi:YgiT-type zinc finger domain-containing protein